jgi:hypothetical protein
MTNEKKISASLGNTPLSDVLPDDGLNREPGEHSNHESTSTRSSDEKPPFARIRENGFLRKCLELVSWTPKRCRWDPADPPKFSMGLNLLFGFVSCLLFALHNSHN